jgi:DNA-directed RNA polymerase specialized sigma24 family protein
VVHDASPAALDPLLVPFVHAPTDESAAQALAALVETQATPLVRQVVRRHLSVRRGEGDAADDVAHTALACLTRQLWQIRRGDAEPIASLGGYVAQVAANACHAWLRERRPQRARLQQRIRYVLRHHAQLALWTNERDGWVCGRGEWRNGAGALDALEAAEWRGRLTIPSGAAGGSEAARLVALVEAIVETLGRPARLEDVVTLAADALGIDDTPLEPASADDLLAAPQAVDALESREAPVDHRLAHAQFLARAWKEIVELPLRQRTALLLNLTGPDGGDLLSLVPVTGVASWADIATLLALPLGRIRELAAALPHDDHAIAGLLGVTRRQVINLRKCARERLARRLGFTRGTRKEGGL